MKVGYQGDITFYDTSGNASFVYDESAGSTFNEQGDNKDFRVESDTVKLTRIVCGCLDVITRVGVGEQWTIISLSSLQSAANFQIGKGYSFTRNNVNGDNTNWTKLHNTASTVIATMMLSRIQRFFVTGSVEITARWWSYRFANTAGSIFANDTNVVHTHDGSADMPTSALRVPTKVI